MTKFEVEEYNRRQAINTWMDETSKMLPSKPESLSDIAESKIQQEIEDWLKTQSHRIWWSRSRMDKPTTGRVGVPDFLMCFAGLFLAVEVKRPGKKPTLEQSGELAWIRKAGGIECVATSFSEVQALIELLTARVEMETSNKMVAKEFAKD